MLPVSTGRRYYSELKWRNGSPKKFNTPNVTGNKVLFVEFNSGLFLTTIVCPKCAVERGRSEKKCMQAKEEKSAFPEWPHGRGTIWGDI